MKSSSEQPDYINIKYAFIMLAKQHISPIISEIHIMGLLFNIKSKRKLALIYYITYSLISVETPAIGVENITSLTRKHIIPIISEIQLWAYCLT